jgi:predicted DNA repair protein MutK
MTELTHRQHTILKAIYPIFVVMIVYAIIDAFISAFPARMDDARWRFGAMGLFIATTPQVTLGVVGTMILSAILGDRMVSRAAGIFGLIFAIMIGGAVLLFGLDALEVRRLVPENAKESFDDAALKSLVMTVMYGLVLVWLGIRSFAVTKLAAGEVAGRKGASGGTLMVGQE